MAKTYTAPGSATAGQVYTSTAHNVIVTDVSNLIVPPMCQVRLTSSINPYTNSAAISWSSSAYDTDAMFTSGTAVTANTAGIYAISFQSYLTATATLSNITSIILKNGTALSQFSTAAYSTIASNITHTIFANLAANDFITTALTINGGSAFIMVGNATEGTSQTRLSMTWVGRTS